MRMMVKSIRTDIFDKVTIDFEKMEYRWKEWDYGLPFKIINGEIFILKYLTNGSVPEIPPEHEQEWHKDTFTTGSNLLKLLSAYEEYVDEVVEKELLSVDNA
jgi:hypothetical protein